MTLPMIVLPRPTATGPAGASRRDAHDAAGGAGFADVLGAAELAGDRTTPDAPAPSNGAAPAGPPATTRDRRAASEPGAADGADDPAADVGLEAPMAPEDRTDDEEPLDEPMSVTWPPPVASPEPTDVVATGVAAAAIAQTAAVERDSVPSSSGPTATAVDDAVGAVAGADVPATGRSEQASASDTRQPPQAAAGMPTGIAAADTTRTREVGGAVAEPPIENVENVEPWAFAPVERGAEPAERPTEPTLTLPVSDLVAASAVPAADAAATEAGGDVDVITTVHIPQGEDPLRELQRSELQRIGASRLGLDVATSSLGNVRVEAIERAGELQLRLGAEQLTARALLADSLPELREQLRADGIDVASVDISAGHGRTRDGRADQPAAVTAPLPGEPVAEATPTDVTTDPPELAAAGRVDVRL